TFSAACARLRQEGESAFDLLHDGALAVLANDLGSPLPGNLGAFPKQLLPKTPTLLARRLSLVLHGQRWRNFWRFGAVQAAETRARALILAQVTPWIDELIAEFFDPSV